MRQENTLTKPLILLLAGLGAVSAQAEILNDWQFDDPDLTGLNNVSNSAPASTLTFGSSDTFGWETDGTGLLRDTSFINYFRDANIVDINSGSSFLRCEYDSWNFNTNSFTVGQGENIAFGFRDGTLAANLVLARLTRTTNEVITLRVTADDGTKNLATFPAENFTNGVDVVIGVDLDANSYQVLWREGSDPFVLGTAGPINATNNAGKIRFHSQNNFGTPSGDFMSVDRLYHGETLEDVGISALLNDWRFDDPVGTELVDALNVGLEAVNFGGAATPGLETDGNGVLLNASSNDYFRMADMVNITSGGAFLRLDVEGWDFPVGTAFNQGEQIAIGFRDEETSGSGANLVLAKLTRRTNDTAVVLRVTDDAGSTDITPFPPEDYTNGLSIVVAVDVTADTYDMYYKTGGESLFTLGASGDINPTNTADLIRFQTQGDYTDGGESLRIGRLYQAASLMELGIGNEVPFTEVVVANTSGLAFESELGAIYLLERSAGGPGNWVFTGMKAVGNGGIMTLFDPEGLDPTAVYRIVTPNPLP